MIANYLSSEIAAIARRNKCEVHSNIKTFLQIFLYLTIFYTLKNKLRSRDLSPVLDVPGIFNTAGKVSKLRWGWVFSPHIFACTLNSLPELLLEEARKT